MKDFIKHPIDPPKYIYNGEDEVTLLNILKELGSVHNNNLDESSKLSLGRIIVPKDFEGSWINRVKLIYGWSIVYANVARVYIKEK